MLKTDGPGPSTAPQRDPNTQMSKESLRHWRREAQAHEEAGEFEAAEPFWRRVLEQDPDDMDAPERLALAQIIAGHSAAPSASTVRVIALGNCQTYSMSACLRALNPDLRVAALSWTELRTTAQVERLLTILDGVDAVLVQPVNLPEVQRLSAPALAGRVARCVEFPRIHFTGFHPDALRAPGRALKGLIGPWHSALVMAGYGMGLSEDRTEELFNAYVYGALGYFDEHGKASSFLQASFADLGWDTPSGLKDAAQPFVSVPYHPRIEPMMDLAREAAARLGIDTDPEALPPPDPLLRFGAWPIYPEVGKRLGLRGRMQFDPPGEPQRAMALRDAIAWCYALYARSPPEALAPRRVKKIIEILRAEGI